MACLPEEWRMDCDSRKHRGAVARTIVSDTLRHLPCIVVASRTLSLGFPSRCSHKLFDAFVRFQTHRAGSRFLSHCEAANSKAVEKLLLPGIIPPCHVIFRRQVKYDAIDSVRHAGLKPSIASLRRKHARTRRLEI